MHDWFEISNKGKKTGEVQLKLEFFSREIEDQLSCG